MKSEARELAVPISSKYVAFETVTVKHVVGLLFILCGNIFCATGLGLLLEILLSCFILAGQYLTYLVI